MASVRTALAAIILLAGGATAVAALGGAFSSSQLQDGSGGLEETRPPVKAKPLSLSSNFSSSYNADNLSGKKYSKYLSSTEEDNKDWWEESYARYQKESSFSDDFTKETKVTSAFSTTDEKALNKVCETVYKKEIKEIEWNHKPWEKTTQRRNDFWKYCSIFKERALTIIEDDFANSGDIGSTGGKLKRTLLSTKPGSNIEVWKVKQEELNAETTPSEYFKEVKGNNDIDALRKKCASAYKISPLATASENETTSKPKEESLIKYCSVEEPKSTEKVAEKPLK